MKRHISKSKFLSGLQCSKLLWTAYNAKHLIPSPDDSLEAIFEQGHEVGALAKQLFPGGIEIGGNAKDLPETIRLTQGELGSRRPLFEAAFEFQGGYCRVDILNPVKGEAWDLIEVKSTTGVKDVHLEDLAFQAWVLTNAGLKIRRCYLCCINSDFVRSGEIDPQKYFKLQDVTADLKPLTGTVEEHLDQMAKIIDQKECPDIKIGNHCDDPYTCPLHEQCWGFLPPASVFTLYRGGKKGFALLEQGIEKLQDIPADFRLTANQAIQRSALLANQPHIDQPAIDAFLSQLEFPISYLDFETIGTAVPLFDQASPYQQIPFQYSLHVMRSPRAKPEHYEFLAEDAVDPRAAFMRQLVADLPATGSVVTYNASFEKSRLEECCAIMPEFMRWLKKLKPRIVDLLIPFRGFRYYHPLQNGTASMKAVLPALTGKGYGDLEIQEGGSASREFLRVTFGQVPAKERSQVRKNLLAYCCQDTEGMVSIVEALQQLGKP